MRNRLPVLLFAIGIFIVALYPRLAARAGWTKSDFVTGAVMGAGIGIELVGATMMINRSRGRTSRCGRAA